MTFSTRKINSLIKKSLYPASQDRITYIDAVGADSQEGREAEKTIESFKLLEGKKIKDITSDKGELVEALYSALLYASQWESGLGQALQKSDPNLAKESYKNMKDYDELRHTLFGKNKLEQLIENAKTVNVMDIKTCGSGVQKMSF